MALGPLRVGILGAGLIAPIHAAGFQEVPEQARVVAVCDTNHENAENLATIFDARIFSDYKDILADPEVDLVDILLPHHLHYEVAMAAIQAKKHIILEKPVAVTYSQSLEIYESAMKAGLYFAVAENTRFIRAYLEAEKVLRSGRLGQVTLIRTFLPANERIRLMNQFGTETNWFKSKYCFLHNPHTEKENSNDRHQTIPSENGGPLRRSSCASQPERLHQDPAVQIH